MHPVLAEQELQVIHRHRHELIAAVECHRVASMHLVETPSARQTPAPRRHAIETLQACFGYPTAWIAGRRTPDIQAKPINTPA